MHCVFEIMHCVFEIMQCVFEIMQCVFEITHCMIHAYVAQFAAERGRNMKFRSENRFEHPASMALGLFQSDHDDVEVGCLLDLLDEGIDAAVVRWRFGGGRTPGCADN